MNLDLIMGEILRREDREHRKKQKALDAYYKREEVRRERDRKKWARKWREDNED